MLDQAKLDEEAAAERCGYGSTVVHSAAVPVVSPLLTYSIRMCSNVRMYHAIRFFWPIPFSVDGNYFNTYMTVEF